MTEPTDRVDALVDAFLDFLEGRGDEPTFDNLSPDERQQAEELIRSMRMGRGLDPYSSPPSLQSLLVGTPFEAALQQLQPASDELLETIRNELDSSPSGATTVAIDIDARRLGLRSDFVIRVNGQRLRVVVLSGTMPLMSDSAVASAHALFGAFPDTAGVLLIHADAELSSIAIDPFEATSCIVVPSGDLEPPGARRPVLPLADSVRLYLEYLAPDLSDIAEPFDRCELDAKELAHDVAQECIRAIAHDGARARTSAKKTAWSRFDSRHIELLTKTVLDAITTSDGPDAIEERIRLLART